MKNRIIVLLLILNAFTFYKAQTISLDQLSQCKPTKNCPNYKYVVDISYRLNKFIGTWKGTYSDGRTYEFHFNVKEADGGWFNEKFWDRIIGRFIVKDNVGNIIYTSMNADDLHAMGGYYFDKNLKRYMLSYSGNADCNDKGNVYIWFADPNNLNQLSLTFVQEMDIIASCPNGYKTVMPDVKILTLTKQ
ncbi:DUF6705 family protein [Chryseobacterium camelliae]|uniref:DUF6705 family protein n=1 Tax=Chryseobacterium camelliae TaxID=1265445 RepID=UPI00285826A1|nr:DUF6705 family protein [Chryseobacterium camelliae]MDR6517073.1 hypothetical protein [Chryseobacterium camelliae]